MVLVITSLLPLVYAQLSLGEPALHKLITINLGDQGDVHVTHEINKARSVVHVETIEGSLSNLNVTDVEGNKVEFGTTGLESITGITIFSSQDDVVIEYDLQDVLYFEDGLWKWDYFNLETTKIIFPKDVDLLFVNDRPVMLHDAVGITCYGRTQGVICDAFIEYVIDEPTMNTEIKWEDKKFIVQVKTLTEISSFNFDQPTKRINFDVSEDDQLITLIIPLELLWSPYDVYLNGEKILKHEFFSNETHSWLNFRPENS
ncbi:MAG: hypothetical protein QQN48_02985, partial [Nitrosopumilus sp.]